MSDPKHGIAGIVSEAVEATEADARPADLFDEEGPEKAASPFGHMVGMQRGRGQRGQGKKTLAFRDFYLSRFKHPAVALGELVSLPVELLAAQLGCKRLEAAELQRKALVELLPYLESRAPIAIKAEGEAPVFMIGAVPGSVTATDQTGISLVDLFNQKLQQLNTIDLPAIEDQSHDTKSHESE